MLLHDNARAHVSCAIQQTILKLSWEVLPHAVYSPNLAPSNYNLFWSMMHALTDNRFKTLTMYGNSPMTLSPQNLQVSSEKVFVCCLIDSTRSSKTMENISRIDLLEKLSYIHNNNFVSLPKLLTLFILKKFKIMKCFQIDIVY